MSSFRTLKIVLSALLAFGLMVPEAHAFGHGGGEKKKGGGAGYTPFDTIQVFTAATSRSHGSLSITMGLATDDAKLGDQIALYGPRLQDAYVSRMQTYAAGLSSTSVVNTDYIATQLQQATDNVLGRKGAKVLLGTVLLN